MTLFNFTFPILMIVFPLAFSLLIGVKPSSDEDLEKQEATIRRLRNRLLLGTTLSILLFVPLFFSVPSQFSGFLWVLCFPLWFMGALPLLRAKDHGWRPALAQKKVRTASLTRRDARSPVPNWSWMMVLGIWMAMLAATILLVGSNEEGRRLAWIIGFPLMGGGWIVGGIWISRQITTESEPMDASGSEELARAYEDFRNWKIWLWHAISAAAMMVTAIPALLIAWKPEEMLTPAIWIGAGGGTLLGILGGVFGGWADLHRARINRLYQDITSDAG